MGESAESAAGYHVIWGISYIGECPELKIPDKTRNMIENSTHDTLAVNGGQETQSAGTVTLGKGSVKIYYIGSTVHDSLETDFDAKTERDVYFIRPSNGALGGTCRKGTAIISKMAEPVDKKGLITWETEITMTSGLTTIKTPATGLTTPFFVIGDDDTPTPNTITPVPAAAAAVYGYTVELYSNNATFTITPTATAGTIYVNNTLVATGVASAAITAPAAGKKLYVPIVVYETSKTPKPYLLCVSKGSVTKP